MSPLRFEDALDRTIRWLLEPRAIRWRRGNPPARDKVLMQLLGTVPRIAVGADAVQDPSGRDLARMAVRLIARIFPHVVVDVDVDEAFAAELRSLAEEIWPGRSVMDETGPELCVGNPRRRSGASQVFVGGDGWVAKLQRSPLQIRTMHPAASLVAAAFGAAEITKEAFRSLLRDHGGTWTGDDLASADHIAVNTFAPGNDDTPPIPTFVDLGEVLVVSAGALTNAVLAVLLSDATATIRLSVLDDDPLDLTNLNRYLLVSWSAAEARLLKVEHLALFSSDRLHLTPVPEAYVSGHSPHALVLVGADRLSARHAVQKDGHGVILNAASEPELVRISAHQNASGTACLTCINPGGDDAVSGVEPTIAFVSALAGGLHAAQLYAKVLEGVVPGRVVELHPMHASRGIQASVLRKRPDCSYCSRLHQATALAHGDRATALL